MAMKKSSPTFKVGDRVRILYSANWRGRVVELRGPLGPRGAQVYRVRVPDKPKPIYIELPGDQLVLIPTPANDEAGRATRRRTGTKRGGQ
jgi:hypothetical protein